MRALAKRISAAPTRSASRALRGAMLESLSRASGLRPSLAVQVAMEQQMGCAMGVCLGCVTPTTRGYQRVCRDRALPAASAR